MTTPTTTTTGYLFQSDTAKSAVPVPHTSTLLRVFTCSSSSHAPCPPECHISHCRQIHFTFDVDGVVACLVLNLITNTCWMSAHRWMATRLRDCIPMEEQRLPHMILYALTKARAAVGDCIPTDNKVLYMKVRAISLPVTIRPLQPDDWMETGGPFAAPADERAIESLTTNKLSSSSTESLGTCTICLEDFSDGEETLCMPCSHGFHEHCIREWLKNSHYCPMCRFQLPAAA